MTPISRDGTSIDGFAQVGAGTETHPRGGPRSKTEIHTIDYVTPHNVHYLISAETPQEAINRKFSGSEPYKTWSVTDVYYQSCPSTKAVLLNEKGKFQKFIVTNLEVWKCRSHLQGHPLGALNKCDKSHC